MISRERPNARRRRTWVAGAALVTLASCGPAGPPPRPQATMQTSAPPRPQTSASTATAYRFARVIVAPGEVIEGGVIVVDGATIRGVLAADAPLPGDAAIVELGRYTAIPGLIDAHTHLTFCWDPRWDGGKMPDEPLPPAEAMPFAEANARRTLEAGITTVRDLGALHQLDLALAARIDAGEVVGPRILGAGEGIWPPGLVPGEAEDGPSGAVRGPEEVAAAARDRLADGARVIKLWASTGTDDDLSGQPLYSYEEIKAAVDVAHAHGVKVAVHDYLGEVADDIIRAGADTIEHARELSDASLAAMRERGVAYVPTIWHNVYYRDNIERLGLDPAAAAGFDAFIDANVATARRAKAAGVTIVMGSDAVFTGFGDNTRELDVFVERVGMTPMEALATATTDAARALGIDDRLGAIRPGYEADFVVIDGDLASIEDIHRVVSVVKRGAVIDVAAPAGGSGMLNPLVSP